MILANKIHPKEQKKVLDCFTKGSNLNANKVISIDPSKKNGLIEQLHVKSEANRERETLNVKLWVEDVRITGTEVCAYEQVAS